MLVVIMLTLLICDRIFIINVTFVVNCISMVMVHLEFIRQTPKSRKVTKRDTNIYKNVAIYYK